MSDVRTVLTSLWLAASCVMAGCAEDDAGEAADDMGMADAGTSGMTANATDMASVDPSGDGADVDSNNVPTDPECNMNGSWIMASSTINTALGASQIATGWGYLEITHSGDRFAVQRGYECGLVVRGSADVSMGDRTTEELAKRTRWGREGSFKLDASGNACQFDLDRSYIIRGADADRFLWDLWQPGDAPKPLSEFTLPTNEAEGMEDWDEDGFEGITHLTALGDRYVAQLDWNEVSGSVPPDSDEFGGPDVLVVDYDSLEVLSSQTAIVLQVTSTPMPPGWAHWARVSPELVLVESGEHPELDTCKNAMALAVEKFGDPPRP